MRVCVAVNKNCSSHKTYYLIFLDGARQMNELIPRTGFLLLLLLLSFIVGAFKCMLVCNLHLDRFRLRSSSRHGMQLNLLRNVTDMRLIFGLDL